MVAQVRGGAFTTLVLPGVLAQVRAAATSVPRLLPVVEVDTLGKGLALPQLRELGVAYLVLAGVPPSASPRAPDGLPVRLLAHAGGSTAAASAVALAKLLGAAVEVGPGPDRFDSVGARLARDAGVPLSVPTGIGEEADGPTGPVALGFARRAGAAPRDVVNALADDGSPRARPAEEAPTGRKVPRGRPKR